MLNNHVSMLKSITTLLPIVISSNSIGQNANTTRIIDSQFTGWVNKIYIRFYTSRNTLGILSNKVSIKRKSFISFLFVNLTFLISISLSASTYYVATTGNDSNAGTTGSPFASLQKFDDVLTDGNTAYIPGGTYIPAKSNTWYQTRWHNLTDRATETIKLYAYPDETPLLGYAAQNFRTATRWLVQMYERDYERVNGLNLTNVAQSASSPVIGLNLTNSNHFLIENISLSHIGGLGFPIGRERRNTGDLNTTNSAYNTYLNCDAFDCNDPTSPRTYGGANGFIIVHNNGVRNTYSSNTVFRRCSAWNCSDDDWDFLGSDSYPVTLENCWSFWNGYQYGTTNQTGDGDGFKMGPNLTNLLTTLTHIEKIVSPCIITGKHNSEHVLSFLQHNKHTNSL